MKFTTTLLAASAAAIALTTGTEARLRGSHGRHLSIHGSKTAYSYGGTNYNHRGYKADPTRSAMDAARRAGVLTNSEARRMGYSSNSRDEDDLLGDCYDRDFRDHKGCDEQKEEAKPRKRRDEDEDAFGSFGPGWGGFEGRGSTTAYSYGGTNYNSGGYKADPTRSAMDAARRAGALTNSEAMRMGYFNYRDEDDLLGDCNDGDWYMHRYCDGFLREKGRTYRL
eukprot:Stramenopile-MAST_4_protein_3223